MVRLFRIKFAALAASATCLIGACGNPPGIFANQIIGADGRPIHLEQIEAIVDDSALTADQRRDALRNLGIHDEKLIDALLTL